MHFKNLPDCCWNYLCGINDKNITLKKFQIACLKNFNNGSNKWRCPTKVTGAVLFCGAYGGGAIALEDNTSTYKRTILNSLEKVCGFIEDNDLGYIIEIPNFKNGLHLSTITPRLWVIDQVNFKKAMKNWITDTKIKKQYYKTARMRW